MALQAGGCTRRGSVLVPRPTYAEQLRHPLWQKKRLLVLEAADWKCRACSAADKTLHVHHKHYVKGRQVWEYELAELEALCEDCHEDAHKAKARIDQILAMMPSVMWERLADMLAGYCSEFLAVEMLEGLAQEHYGAGTVARYLGNFDTLTAQKVSDEISIIEPSRFRELVGSEFAREHEALVAAIRAEGDAARTDGGAA